jgi:hypothetical protein
MSPDREPSPNKGFLYILSNKSMPGVFKVGFTTNSVRQRAQELSTTGVPTEFQAEKIFEIEVGILRLAESQCHRKLKGKNFHHGKEFFKAPLSCIVEAVEDSIYEISKKEASDLIGLAAERAAVRERQQKLARLHLERENLARELEMAKREQASEQAIRKKRFSDAALAEAEKEATYVIYKNTQKETGISSGKTPFISMMAWMIIYVIGFFVTLAPANSWLQWPWLIGFGALGFYIIALRPTQFDDRLDKNMNNNKDIKNEIYLRKMKYYDSAAPKTAETDNKIASLVSKINSADMEIKNLLDSNS